MGKNLYMDGQIVPRDHERFLTGIKTMSDTFDLAHDPNWPELKATSHISGKKINRFTHIHQSIDDLNTRRDLTKKFFYHAGSCIQRCGGADTINALSVVTYDIDKKYGTEYYKRFLKYLEYFQENDLVAPITMTDVKGDRSKRPHQQADPDLYLRIVEKKSDGIVVRGAKNCNSMASYSDELIVSPSRALTKEEGDWAVAFAIPADTEGVIILGCGVNYGHKRKHMPAKYAEYGVADAFTIFDNVFVPWDRVFMMGEVEFAPLYGATTAIYHRFNYTACKPAWTDLFVGATALAAEYNNIEKHEHIQEKIGHMVACAVLVDAAGEASAKRAWKAPSGTWVPGSVGTHAGRWLAGLNMYREFETMSDIAGGLGTTLPYEGDFFNPKTGPLLNKYIKRKADVPAENVHKLWRYMQDTIAGEGTGYMQGAGLHGGGSPIMEIIGLMRDYDLEEKKKIVKRLAGIPID